MRTLVDRTTLALGVEVCSFYLLNRDGERLTLAATNGLDTEQVGRVSLALGEGLTGRAAADRAPVQSSDVTVDPRFSWVRGFDIHGLHAMLSVPLIWNEAFGIGLGEMEWMTINALKSAFVPFDERLRLIAEVVKPGYARLRAREAAVAISV